MAGNNTLYLVGGTGGLGAQLAKGLVLADGFSGGKKALVRNLEKAKPLLPGWELVEFSSYDDPQALEAALVDAKTVVSTVGGMDKVKIETAVVTAAKAAGADLYVSSQFSVDIRRWGTEFPFFAWKKAVLDVAEKEGLPVLTVFTGCFSDLMFGFFVDLENSKVEWIGDGNTKVSFTHRADVGKVLAKALSDSKYYDEKGGALCIEGDYMSYNDATKLLSKALGKPITTTYLDAQEALKTEKELLQKGLAGDMGSLIGSFKLHLLGEPARGNLGGDLHALADNWGVKMQTLEEVFESGVYGPKQGTAEDTDA